MSGMRTVSFFGPNAGGIEGGRAEADNGRVAGGGFGEGKSWWMKYPRGQTAVKREQAHCRFREPATGSGRSRAVSHLAPAASWEAGPATGCEPFLFLVGQARPSVLKNLIKNRRLVTTQS